MTSNNKPKEATVAKFKVEVVATRTSRVILEVEAASPSDAEDQVEDILYQDHQPGHDDLLKGLQYEGSPLVSVKVAKLWSQQNLELTKSKPSGATLENP